MSEFFNEKRVVDITIHQGVASVGKLLFDTQGNIIEGDASGLDSVLKSELSNIARAQELESGEDEARLLAGDKEYELKIKRYINCVMADVPVIMAEHYPYKTAVIDPLGRKELTFEEVNTLSNSLAKAIISLGVKKGEHVGIIMDNCWEQIVVKFAIAKAGAVLTNISYHEKKDGLQEQIVHDDVVMAFVKQNIPKKEHMDMFYQVAPELLEAPAGQLNLKSMPGLKYIVVTNPERPRLGAVKFQDLIKSGEALDDNILEERRAEIDPFDACSIIHTSGSTGKPKAVVLGNCQLVENVMSHIKVMGLNRHDTLCMTAPMFHAFGTIGSMLSTFMSGGTVICYDNAGEIELIDMIIEQNVTVLCSVPTIFIRLCNDIRKRKIDMREKSMRLCVTAGAPCPPALIRDINNLIGVEHIVGMYGMTETCPGLASHVAGDSAEVISNTLGRFWPGVVYKLADPETGIEVPDGETGEICVKGYMVMQGYYKKPEETAKLIDKDGWVHTGDLGLMRSDGNLVFKGRCKDLIISKGENISPVEVEACLKNNDKIDQVAVVGAPDETSGEIVYAYIVLNEGESLDLSELKKWCKGKIATIKIPEKINIIDEMPLMANGKIDKKILKKMVAEEYEK